MNILILQRSLLSYNSAFYQSDIVRELQNENKLFFYGPGYTNYNKKNSAHDILSKLNSVIDLIIFLHNSVDDRGKIDLFPDFSNIKTKKVYFINKEYLNLNYKLKFAKKNKIDLIVTHHHEFKKYQLETNIKTIWMPFAANINFYKKNYTKFKDRPIDIFTSGIVFNKTQKGSYEFDRLSLAKKFYNFFLDIPLKKKNIYSNLKIILAFDYSNYSFFKKIIYVFRFKSLSFGKKDTNDYYEHLYNSKITYTTLSSLDLVSPKIFESMISGCLTFVNSSALYDFKKLNIKDKIVEFNNDEDFKKKIEYYVNRPNESQIIIDRAVKFVEKNHTWKQRIKNLIDEVNLI